MKARKMKNGERVEVQLRRGMADEWYPGQVIDAKTQRVELEEPYTGGGTTVAQSDIAAWRPRSLPHDLM